jgi:hypothetical protein
MLLENASRVGVLTHTRTETALLLGEVLASEPPGFATPRGRWWQRMECRPSVRATWARGHGSRPDRPLGAESVENDHTVAEAGANALS